MASNGEGITALGRVTTGIAGLDTILGGGLLEHGLYIVEGRPGTGKTVLANQIAFHRARLGERVIYVTLVGETHDRLFQYLAGFDFPDLSLLPQSLAYLSAFGTLDGAGLPGVLGLIADTLRGRGPSFLVLDGLRTVRERAGSDIDFQKGLHALQALAGFHGCTMLFLTHAPVSEYSPEEAVADGLIKLHYDRVRARAVRSLSVHKFRGGAYLGGRHMFRIRAPEGAVVYPRLETLIGGEPAAAAVCRERVTTGIEGLDRMLLGGVPAGSITLLAGPSGSGKTTMALLALTGSTPAAPGLFFGCYEPPAELRLKAEAIGIDLGELVATGAVHILWQSPIESFPDELAHRLLDEIRATGARRVAIDGLGAFERTLVFRERLDEFFGALALKLGAAGVTAFGTTETRKVVAPHEVVAHEILLLADNVLLLRFAEHRSRLLRLLSVIKVRRSGFDPAIVPFEIGERGITLGEPLAHAEAIVRGAVGQVESTEPST